MKKFTVLAVVAVLAVCVSSCDFVRSIAGRPTSDELATGVAAPGSYLETQVVTDSLCCADSLCCQDSLCCAECACCADSLSCCKAEGECCCKAEGECCCKAEEGCPKENCCCKEACCDKPEECGECDKAEKCEVAEECDKCEKAAAQAPKPAAKPAPVKKAPAARIFRGPVCEKAALENKYFVVIGTFKVEANACAQAKRAEKAGYKVVSIPFANCLTAVAVAPTDNRAEALKSLDEVKTKKFCPADAYVLVVK